VRAGSGRERARQRRLGSALASAALHLVLLAAIFAPLGAAGESAETAEPDASGAMEVTLVSPPPTSAPEAATTDANSALLARLTHAPDGIAVAPKPDRSSALEGLAQRLSRNAARAEVPQSRESRAGADPNALSEITQEAAQSRRASNATDLAGSFEPCWDKFGGSALAPVVIEIALDGRGRLAKPPMIVRAKGAALDERRLRSEAAAISAIAGCAPQSDLRFANATYRVELGSRQSQ